jgi:hypothetical protein
MISRSGSGVNRPWGSERSADGGGWDQAVRCFVAVHLACSDPARSPRDHSFSFHLRLGVFLAAFDHVEHGFAVALLVARISSPTPRLLANLLKNAGLTRMTDLDGFDCRWARYHRRAVREALNNRRFSDPPGIVAAMSRHGIRMWC